MSDNTKQWDWIVTLKAGFAILYQYDPDVFVAGNLLWYPVEGNPKIRIGPDVLVAVGRPRGYRGSYLQWKEGGMAPQLVIEVLSPGNSGAELLRKGLFYQKYGVAEFYIYDPDNGTFAGHIRIGDTMEPIPDIRGWKSPLTGVVFDLDDDGNLLCTRPDGTRFESLEEMNLRARDERAQLAAGRAQLAAERAHRARLEAQLRAHGLAPDGEGA